MGKTKELIISIVIAVLLSKFVEYIWRNVSYSQNNVFLLGKVYTVVMFFMKKLFITGITAAAVFATCTATAFAAPSIIVNSNTLATDQEPVIVDSRTLVPMRAIFEALGRFG